LPAGLSSSLFPSHRTLLFPPSSPRPLSLLQGSLLLKIAGPLFFKAEIPRLKQWGTGPSWRAPVLKNQAARPSTVRHVSSEIDGFPSFAAQVNLGMFFEKCVTNRQTPTPFFASTGLSFCSLCTRRFFLYFGSAAIGQRRSPRSLRDLDSHDLDRQAASPFHFRPTGCCWDGSPLVLLLLVLRRPPRSAVDHRG